MGTHPFESEVRHTDLDVTCARQPVRDFQAYIVDRPEEGIFTVEACQRGYQGRLVRWQQGYVRGATRLRLGADAEAQALGVRPYSSSNDFRDETIFQGQDRAVAPAHVPGSRGRKGGAQWSLSYSPAVRTCCTRRRRIWMSDAGPTDWLALYTEEAEFWLPAWDEEARPTNDPQAQLALIYYTSRVGLEDRVWRIQFGYLPRVSRTQGDRSNNKIRR